MLGFCEVACDVHKELLIEYAERECSTAGYTLTESEANLKRK